MNINIFRMVMEHLKHSRSFQTDKTRQADLLMPALSCENRPLKALLLCTCAYLLFVCLFFL